MIDNSSAVGCAALPPYVPPASAAQPIKDRLRPRDLAYGAGLDEEDGDGSDALMDGSAGESAVVAARPNPADDLSPDMSDGEQADDVAVPVGPSGVEDIEGCPVVVRDQYLSGRSVYQARWTVKCPKHPRCLKRRGVSLDADRYSCCFH